MASSSFVPRASLWTRRLPSTTSQLSSSFLSRNYASIAFRRVGISPKNGATGVWNGGPQWTRRASHVPPSASASLDDPTNQLWRTLLIEGTQLLENKDLEGAREKYKRSLEVKETPECAYNLGVVEYQLENHQVAIQSWQQTLRLDPSHAAAHTNLASAYILSKTPQPKEAIEHLKKAVELEPRDGEIRFNLGAVLESCDHLETALSEYQRAKDLGIERASQNIRNVGAKLYRRRLEEQKQEEQSA